MACPTWASFYLALFVSIKCSARYAQAEDIDMEYAGLRNFFILGFSKYISMNRKMLERDKTFSGLTISR